MLCTFLDFVSRLGTPATFLHLEQNRTEVRYYLLGRFSPGEFCRPCEAWSVGGARWRPVRSSSSSQTRTFSLLAPAGHQTQAQSQ